jgi:flagellin
MPLGILYNIPSLAAENQLDLTATALNSTLEQLSSGSRINTGADDAAGLAIANGLQANVTALSQSVSNANDGIGELQLADGALAQVTTLLNRAVTLATESGTGTVSNSQRVALQAEYASILTEINSIGTSTTYNGQAIFLGGSVPNLNEQVSPVLGPAAGGATSLYNGTELTTGGVTSVTAGGTTFTFTGAAGTGTDPNVVEGATTGLTAASLLTAGDTVITTTGSTPVSNTFTQGGNAGTTVGSLIAAINATTGLSAQLVNGQLSIQDTAANGDLAVTGTETIFGAFANAPQTSTVQDLINAINGDTTVGAKAALVAGQLQITDPLDRGNLVVSTTDTQLGAAVAGAPTVFGTPDTTSAATPNLNQLVGSISGLTDATAIADGVTSFVAGGKTFTYTAAGGTGTVGALINAINSPATDPAGLQAYLNATGNLTIVDPNNNGDLAAGPTVAAAVGTLSNPTSTGSPTTEIFLSDSTSVGSSQIGVTIGSLQTQSITDGGGNSGIDLADTDLSTQADAQSALILIGSAIANIASVRGNLGAVVNRLTAASNVLNSQVQNLTSAESTITAADIPTVVANLTKYSILEQTGISALAQANQQQQLVLKLLQ